MGSRENWDKVDVCVKNKWCRWTSIVANGNRVSSVYDALGRRTVEINGVGNRTTSVYDAVGQTSALVDARANRHSFTYDSTGAQTQQIGRASCRERVLRRV